MFTYMWVVYAVEFVFLMFHASVGVFIGSRLFTKQKKDYNSAFYTMYVILTIADCSSYFAVFYLSRIQGYGVLPKHVVEELNSTATFVRGFVCFFQFGAHTLIAFNRYTAIVHPMRHVKLWSGYRFALLLLSNVVFCLACASVRLCLQAEVVVLPDGKYFIKNFPAWTVYANGSISAFASVATSVVSAVFEFKTYATYRRMTPTDMRRFKKDFGLLVYAMCGLVSQAVMAAFFLTLYYFSVSASVPPTIASVVGLSLPYAGDLLSLTGSLCLLFTSKTVRHDYLRFYGIAQLFPSTVNPSTTMTNSWNDLQNHPQAQTS